MTKLNALGQAQAQLREAEEALTLAKVEFPDQREQLDTIEDMLHNTQETLSAVNNLVAIRTLKRLRGEKQ